MLFDRTLEQIVSGQKLIAKNELTGTLSTGYFKRQEVKKWVNSERTVENYRKLHTLAHANLQPYYCYIEDQKNDRISFVSEWCHGISLQQYLQYVRKNPQSTTQSGHRMLYLAMRVLHSVAQAIVYLRSNLIIDFYLSIDSVMLYLLDDVKLSNYCIRRKESSRDQPVLDFMKKIFDECLSPSNFQQSPHQSMDEIKEFFKRKSLCEIYSLLNRNMPVQDYLQQFLEYYGLYRKKVTEVYETSVMAKFMEEVENLYQSNGFSESTIIKKQYPQDKPPVSMISELAHESKILHSKGPQSMFQQKQPISTIPPSMKSQVAANIPMPPKSQIETKQPNRNMATTNVFNNANNFNRNKPQTSFIQSDQPHHKSTLVADKKEVAQSGSINEPRKSTQPLSNSFQKKAPTSCIQQGTSDTNTIQSGTLGSLISNQPNPNELERSQPVMLSNTFKQPTYSLPPPLQPHPLLKPPQKQPY